MRQKQSGAVQFSHLDGQIYIDECLELFLKKNFVVSSIFANNFKNMKHMEVILPI